MKKYARFLLFAGLFACSGSNKNEDVEKVYGSDIDTSGSIEIDQISANMNGSAHKTLTIKGTVSQVCQTEGCWLEIADQNGETIVVRTKDHNYTVPKDLAGKKVYVSGDTHIDTTIVEVLKHYAEDGGKSQAEIDAITKPTIDVVVDASGIVVLK